MPQVTALYAGLLGLLAIVLAVQIGQVRNATGISLGDGGNDELILAMRRHANFIEFVPLALILIGLLELNGVSVVAVHALGATLFIARVCHAYGFRSAHPSSIFRTLGAIGSTLTLAVASIWAMATVL